MLADLRVFDSEQLFSRPFSKYVWYFSDLDVYKWTRTSGLNAIRGSVEMTGFVICF